MTTAEQIKARMYHSPIKVRQENGWTFEDSRNHRGPGKLEAFIQDKLDNGFMVTAGYFTTAVRGFHEYYVAYKARKT